MSRAEDIFQKLVYFGEDAIDEYIVNMQTEELFLDFKQAISIGKNGTTLHKDDRKNLAKCISGFGNSEGGVVIWGVECSRDMEIGDVAKAKVKVKNVHRFLSWLENAISGCTIPSHNKVRNHIISADENGDGFIATYIPKSEIAPLMSTVGNNIYIRSGSNNVPAPYSVIAGMFGRRPQPNLELVVKDKRLDVLENVDEDVLYPKSIDNPPEKYIKISFSIRGHNDSNVIARELYLSCTTASTGSEYNKVRFMNYNQMDSIPGIEGQLNIIPPGTAAAAARNHSLYECGNHLVTVCGRGFFNGRRYRRRQCRSPEFQNLSSQKPAAFFCCQSHARRRRRQRLPGS